NRSGMFSVRTLLLGAALAAFFAFAGASPPHDRQTVTPDAGKAPTEIEHAGRLTSRTRVEPAPAQVLKVGEEIATEAGQRRRLRLDRGVELYVNQGTRLHYVKADKIELNAGEIYVDVADKGGEAFAIETPRGAVKGTHGRWAVRVDKKGTGVVVTR